MRIHLVFVSILLGLAWLGCNSRASFPENNGNVNNVNNQHCSNGVLDPGEACDLDHALTPMFQDGDSCESRGDAGGDLVCDSTHCQVIISECIPAATDCSPLYDTGCDELNCYYFPETDETACADHGDGTEGTFCDSPFQCAPRHTCFQDQCRKVCNPGSTGECTNNATCDPMDWLDGDLGVCPPPHFGCDPLENTGCDNAGDGCYLDNTLGDGYCSASVGTESTGGPFGADVDCEPGNICLQLTDPSQSYCTRLCDAEHWCDAGSNWCAYHPEATVGFCVGPDTSCDLTNPTSCLNDTACVIVNTHGTTTCMYTHGIQENQPCDMNHRCDAGLYCATDFDWRCHRTCQAMADCEPDVCHEMGDWPSNNGQLGYCRPQE